MGKPKKVALKTFDTNRDVIRAIVDLNLDTKNAKPVRVHGGWGLLYKGELVTLDGWFAMLDAVF